MNNTIKISDPMIETNSKGDTLIPATLSWASSEGVSSAEATDFAVQLLEAARIAQDLNKVFTERLNSNFKV